MNKVLVKLYVPAFEEHYDVWIPLNRKIYKVTELLTKAVDEFNGGIYHPLHRPILYNKMNAEPFNVNLSVKESGIKNCSELILI